MCQDGWGAKLLCCNFPGQQSTYISDARFYTLVRPTFSLTYKLQKLSKLLNLNLKNSNIHTSLKKKCFVTGRLATLDFKFGW